MPTQLEFFMPGMQDVFQEVPDEVQHLPKPTTSSEASS